MVRRLAAVVCLVLLSTVAACDLRGPERPPPVVTGGGASTSVKQGQVEPYIVKGVVTTAAGTPLAGAEVWADNTLGYNSNLLATTDESGRYRIELPREPVTTWRMGGQASLEYHGAVYRLPLTGDAAGFATTQGAVRDLQLTLVGPDPNIPGTFHGQIVYVYDDFEQTGIDDMSLVEIVLTPDGPLVDGSAGSVVTRRVDGTQLNDVPVGQYVVTARYLPVDDEPVDLVVRQRSVGSYVSNVTVLLPHETGTTLELEVRLP